MEPKDQKPSDQPAPSSEPAAGSTPPPSGEQSGDQAQSAPHDALGKTNEEIAEEQNVIDATTGDGSIAMQKPAEAAPKPPKKQNALKKFLHKTDIYLLAVILIVVIAGAFAAVNYFNSKKTPKTPSVATEQLTPSTLKALESSNATVGNSAETLTIQGDSVFSGSVLMRNNLDVAGNIELGGNLTVPSITATSTANLATVQVNTLQVANNTQIQGTTNLKNLNVAGASTFSQPITASQITVTNLILSGNAVLQVPNHVAFTGPSPGRSAISIDVLGAGGTTSVNGSDTTGTININSGNDPTAGCFLTINFAHAFTSTPHVMISPVGAAAGALEYYVNRSVSGFSLCSDNAAEPNQVFAFDYFITD